LKVLKRSGKLEDVCTQKVTGVVAWACEGLAKVSVANVVMNAKLQFFDGISTVEIHQALTKSAADLISEFDPDYQYVAGRLLMTLLRKEAYGHHTPPSLLNHLTELTDMGKYTDELLQKYSGDEISILGRYLDNEKDMNYTYASMSQWKAKYLVQDRTTKKVYESPQMAIMLMSMCLFQDYPKAVRKKYVKAFYTAVSDCKLSLPTPIMSGLRTPTKQFSSCTLIEVGDSLDSINGAASAMVKYISQKAGIGVNAGRIRALGSPIRGGDAYHTGAIPFFKHFQSAIKSCSQGGVRGGAATLFYPIWHKDVESFLVLKNNKGSEDNRVRHLDYGVQMNGHFLRKALANESYNLFCPNEAKGLYDAFFEDQEKFEKLYDEYSNSDLNFVTVKAVDLLGIFAQERSGTGRVYAQFVDNCNHGPFDSTLAPIRQANLCMEALLPTTPLNNEDQWEGEISLCTLAAFNVGTIEPSELEGLADLIVRALDALLDYQDYPVKSAEKAKDRRTLGVGVINFAYALAKRGLKYSDGSANDYTHELMESIQFNLLKASCNLAKERGKCSAFGDTLYSKGQLPIDWYNKSVDKLTQQELKQDWEGLRSDIKEHGLRNSTMTAFMPAETSSQISNSTNGIEPARALAVSKGSKESRHKQVVPDVQNLYNAYELVWDMPNNSGYLNLCAIMQKFVDQGISVNTNYKPDNYPNNLVPFSVLVGDIITAWKTGNKTLYYHNTHDGSGEAVEEEEDCDGCKI
jgi:ribonucleoside-diphosphate reductase alpha chain